MIEWNVGIDALCSEKKYWELTLESYQLPGWCCRSLYYRHFTVVWHFDGNHRILDLVHDCSVPSLVICPEKRDGTFYRCISNLFNWLTPIPGTFPMQPSLYQVNIGWGSGLVLPGNKPSLLPLVIKIFVDICRHCTTLGYAIITVYCNDSFLVCTERCLRCTCLFDCTCLSFSITNCYMLVIMIYQYLANIYIKLPCPLWLYKIYLSSVYMIISRFPHFDLRMVM